MKAMGAHRLLVEFLLGCMYVYLMYSLKHTQSYNADCISKTAGYNCNVTCVVDKRGTTISDIIMCDSNKYSIVPVSVNNQYTLSIMGKTDLFIGNLLYITGYIIGFCIIRAMWWCAKRPAEVEHSDDAQKPDVV